MTKKITKRIFVLLLAAMLVFPLISCGEYPDTENNKITFTTSGYGCAKVVDEYDKLLVFNSREELDTYYEAHSEQFGDRFKAICEKYDDAYFEKQTLVCVEIPTVGPKKTGQGLEIREGKYILTITSVVSLSEEFVAEQYPPYYLLIEPETGHKITASNFEVEWITETVE